MLLLSDGRVVKPADLSAVECEQLAVEQRAETGIVPYVLWHALTEEARGRLQTMTQAMALRRLAGEPEPPRTTTPTIDAAALADLLERSAES